MNDIARLGISIDSTQAVAGKTALNDFAAAGRNAATAAENVQKMTASAARGAATLTAALKPANDVLTDMQKKANAFAGVNLNPLGNNNRGADIAAYGQQLDALRAKYNPLYAAGVKYKESLTDINSAFKVGAISATEHANAISATKTAFVNQVAAIKQTGNAYTGLSFDAKNLSFQLVDVTQGLLSGQPVYQIFAQQAGQIGQIIATSPKGLGGLLKELGSSFASVLTPARLAGAGVVASGVAVYAAYQNWKSFTLQLDDSARAAGTTTRSLSALQAAASFKGIGGSDFTKGIDQFARNVYDAKQNMGGLAEVFQANNVHATNFDDALAKAADLIRNARDDQQRLVLLQQMGLPATMQWVRLLSGGADGLKAAKDSAAEFAANDNLIQTARRFDEQWNKGWTNFTLNARSAFQYALESGGAFFDKMERLANQAGNANFWKGLYDAKSAAAAGVTLFSNFDQRFNGDSRNPAANNLALQNDLNQRANQIRGQNTVDPNAIRTANALYQQYVGMLGQTATIKQLELSLDKQIQTYNLTPGAIALTKQQVDTLHRLTVEQALGITQIKAQTDAYKVQSATVGMSVGDATAYAAAQNAINDARRAGRALTPDNIAQIQREAAALGDAARQADLLNFAYTGLVQGPIQTFTSAIAQGSNAWDAFKKAGQSALNAIASKLANMAAQNLWKAALGGSSGGIGGILGSLFGAGNPSVAGAAGVVGGAGLHVVPTFAASGGFISGPGSATSDSIPARLSNGEFVVNARATARNRGLLETINARGFADGGIVDGLSGFNMHGSGAANDNRSSGSGGQRVHVTVGVSVDQNGNLQAYVKDVSQSTATAALDGFVTSPQFPEHVALANKRVGSRMLG